MPKTYIDLTHYLWRRHEELDPSYLKRCKEYLATLPRKNPFEVASDKPLTTDFEKDRNKQLAPSSEVQETSREKRARVLGFRHKVFRS